MRIFIIRKYWRRWSITLCLIIIRIVRQKKLIVHNIYSIFVGLLFVSVYIYMNLFFRGNNHPDVRCWWWWRWWWWSFFLIEEKDKKKRQSIVGKCRRVCMCIWILIIKQMSIYYFAFFFVLFHHIGFSFSQVILLCLHTLSLRKTSVSPLRIRLCTNSVKANDWYQLIFNQSTVISFVYFKK